jgi:effector-binding domain-containing protein
MQSDGLRRRPGPSLEIYVNDPSQVKPADLQTEIAIPIE